MLKTTRLALALLICIASPHVRGLAPADDLDSSLDAVIHDYHLAGSNFLDALARVSREFRVPMGIAWVNTAAAKTEVSFSWKDATLRSIIEAVAKSQPGYRVGISNGVVHVLSVDILPEQNFLQLRIESFQVRHELVEMASRRLRNLVRERVSPTRSGEGGVAGSLITNVGDPRIDVEVKNGNARDALDVLVTGPSNKRIWVVTFQDVSTLTATGFRRTLTLWNNSSIPDDEQPVWDTFRWDERIPWAGLDAR